MPSASKPPAAKSQGEEMMLLHIRAEKLPMPEREYVFARPRLFRADFAWPGHRLLLEVDGGIWSGGRHVRPSGFAKDCEKTNAAALAGFRVLRFTTDQVRDGTAIATLKRALA